MPIFMQDRGEPFQTTRRTTTPEGFLRLPGLAARTGIYEYLARELPGLTNDRHPDDVIRVMREPGEVFDAESLQSYVGKDVTVIHPDEFIDSNNYKSKSVGVVLAADREGDHVALDLLVKSQDGILAIETGLVYLSPGYTTVYEPAPPGAAYDFKQTKIRINHVALVPMGRGGESVKVADKQKGGTMPKLINLPSGQQVEVSDDATAMLISDSLITTTQKVKDAEAAILDLNQQLQQAQDAVKSAEAERDDLKSKTSDEAVAARVTSVLEALDAARELAGKDFKAPSMDVTAIQRAALDAVMPGVLPGETSDAEIAGAFKVAQAAAKSQDSDASDESKRKLAADAAAAQATKPTKDAAADYRKSIHAASRAQGGAN